jgi:hypothetical protein
MSEGAPATSLSVDDVTRLIATARSGTSDPISTSLAIFQGLGDNVVLSGDVLRQALSEAAVPFAEPLAGVLAVVESITKNGSSITFVNTQEIHPVVQGNTLRLKQTVTFQVGLDAGNSSLTQISGVAVHKLLWIDIQALQLRQDGNQRILHIVTAHGTRDVRL